MMMMMMMIMMIVFEIGHELLFLQCCTVALAAVGGCIVLGIC